MSAAYYFTVYSAQKQKEVGHGGISHRLAIKPGYEEEAKRIREEQVKANAEYKRKILNGEQVPPRYTHKVQPAGTMTQQEATQLAKPDNMYVVRGTRRLVTDELLNSKVLSQPTVEQVRQQRTPFSLHLDPHTGNTIFAVGSSKRGKSTVIMRIYDDYYAHQQFVSCLWSANPQAPPYKGHKKLIKAVWGNGKEGERLIKEQKKINVGTNNHYKFLNIFDDVIHVRGSKLMDNLIMTYRNSKMSTIVSMQYSNMLQKCARANINHVLLFGMNTDEAVEVMIKTYLVGYLKKMGIVKMPDMINWYKAVTDDHGFLHVVPETNQVTLHKLNV